LNSKLRLGSLPQTLNGTHVLGLSLLFQGRFTLPYVRHSHATPSSLSCERVAFRRSSIQSCIQSCPSPLPNFLSTTLVSPAGRERHLPVSHGLRSLFPFPSLFFPYFPLFTTFFPLFSPSRASSGALRDAHLIWCPRARVADYSRNAGTRAAPPCCGEVSSLGDAPPRVLRESGGRLSSHPRGRDGVRVKTRP
jgi:hypothetical protein